MRFNPKARLDNSRVGDRGGTRSGGAGGGTRGGGMRIPMPGGRAGGGLGVILLVLVFVVVSCLGDGDDGLGGGAFDQATTGDASRLDSSERYDDCRTGADANEDPDCARMAVENSLFAYWSAELPRHGTPFQPARVDTFTGAVTTGCGRASSQVGPFYCPPDQGIFLDSTFFADVLEGQLGGQGGDFVEPYVLAHEYGHHIQNLMGTMGRVRTQQGPQSDAVRLELQADCYAGLWARAAEGTASAQGVAIFEDLDDADITEALDAAKAVGDDRIQQRSGGRVDSDGWTHGSSEQRQRWFRVGYDTGDLAACDTFTG